MSLLKLLSVSEKEECKVEIDFYVPFSVEIGDSFNFKKENIVYWRTGDIERSLIEIGIGSNTGILRRITLTSFKKASVKNVALKDIEIEEGTPVFDAGIIPKKGIFDFISDFEVYLGKDSIIAMIEKVDKCRKIIRMDRVDIGIDNQNNITHIAINNLDFKEYNELKDALKL